MNEGDGGYALILVLAERRYSSFDRKAGMDIFYICF